MKNPHLHFLLFCMFIIPSLIACKKDKSDQGTATTTPVVNTSSDSITHLNIQVEGMKNTDGKLNFALYNSSQSFNDPAQACKEKFIPLTGTSINFQVDSLPPGTYAFGLFHDENDNGQLDKNLLGIPTEGFAFSNNAMGSFGPPSWDLAKFELPAKSTVNQSITLRFY